MPFSSDRRASTRSVLGRRQAKAIAAEPNRAVLVSRSMQFSTLGGVTAPCARRPRSDEAMAPVVRNARQSSEVTGLAR